VVQTKQTLKGFFGTTFAVILGSEVIRQIGNSKLDSGIKSTSQSFVGLGVVRTAAKNLKGWLK